MNNQTNQDLEHLKLLSIFYYVLAGLCILPMLYGLFYIIMGIFFGSIFMSADIPHRPGEPSPEVFGGLFGGIFALIGFVISGVALVLGILFLKTGRNLSRKQSYTFCFVVACISCIFMPLGTILGIFTLVTLTRDSVKSIFNGQNVSQFGNTPPNWQ